MSRNRILFSCALPFDLRNFIGTGIVDTLATNLEAQAFVVSSFSAKGFRTPTGLELQNFTIPSRTIAFGNKVPEIVKWQDQQLRGIHGRIFAQEYPNGSIGMMDAAASKGPHALVARGLRFAAPSRSRLRKQILRMRHLYRPQREDIRKILDATNPSLLVVSSPGVQWIDQMLMEESSRRGIPTLCVVMSWDNLFSRGPMYRRPDMLAVWSQEMKKHALDAHEYPAERIRVVGAMQFAYYAEPVSPEEIADLRESFDLRSERYIAYVCGSRTATYDCEDIEAMIEALKRTEYKNFKVVVRPHPQAERTAYNSLIQKGVILDPSPNIATESEEDLCRMDRKSARHMAALLAGSEFVVSSWGTTALLEACIFDRPAVQFRWMDSVPHKKPHEVELVRKFQKYIHMKAFDDYEARLYSDEPADLVERFRTLESRKDDFQLRRKRLVEGLVATPLGGCADRIAEAAREAMRYRGEFPE